MNTIICCLSMLVSVLSYGNMPGPGTATIEIKPSFLEKAKDSEVVSKSNVILPYAAVCTISASGSVGSAEFGTFVATITVKGRCDASLAKKMRQAIAALRDEFK
ncbi:MAG: hypothetical protein WBN18_13100 [Flavobacteriaceae bacterium]